MHPISVIKGDGIGAEVVPAAIDVLESLTLGLEFEHFDQVGAERYLADGTTLTDEEFDRLAASSAILFGAVGDPRVTDPEYARGVLLRLRTELDLYVNLRPARLYAERLSPLRDPERRRIDCIVVRENTEGLYTGVGGTLRKGTEDELAVDQETNTYKGVSRIIDYAFSIALERVCVIDKSNAVKFGGQLWQRCKREASERYPSIATSHLYVDAAVMKLVEDPTAFEIIVANNSYGDILSDLTAQLAGGIGCAASGNLNPSTGRGLFEPVHGSAPDIAGRGLANPFGAILSAAMMLDSLGFEDEAMAVRTAVERAVTKGQCTADLGGNLSTVEAAAAVRAHIR